MIYTLPIAIAVLSVVLLLAISAWKAWRVRHDASTLFDIQAPTKAVDTAALGRMLSNARVTDNLSADDRRNLNLLHSRVKLSANKAKTENQQKWMAVGVTVVLGSAALFVVLSKQYDQDSLKWAFGALGTIIGYWLKG